MNVYLVSGLGADKRIFSKIGFDKKLNIVHLDWIPFDRKELMKDYAGRLSRAIDASKPFALIGVSFGGMIAVEIAKVLKPSVTIIISSTILSKHLPFVYKLVGKLGFLDIIPPHVLKASNNLTRNYFFGTKSSEEKKLLKNIIDDSDSHFLKWAVGSILNWKNDIRPENLFHIHGTSDRILYSNKAKPDFTIKNGTHFAIYQNADVISKLINKLILR